MAAVLPDTIISSIETFANNRVDANQVSTQRPTEESMNKYGGTVEKIMLSNAERFAGSFKNAHDTIKFEQHDVTSLGGTSNIFSANGKEQLLIDNMKRASEYALNKGG